MQLKSFLLAFLLATFAGFAVGQEQWADTEANLETKITEKSNAIEDIEFEGFMEEVEHEESMAEIEAVIDEIDQMPDKEKELPIGAMDAELLTAAFNNGPSGLGQTLIALTAIIFSLGLPIIVIALVLYARYRKRYQRNELIKQFVDADRDIPEALFNDIEAADTPKTQLSSGLILVGAGLGIIIGFWFLVNLEVAALGAIPLFIGLARLIVWKIEKSEENQD